MLILIIRTLKPCSWADPRIMSCETTWRKLREQSHKPVTNRQCVGTSPLNLPPKPVSECVVLGEVITHAKFVFDWLTHSRATAYMLSQLP